MKELLSKVNISVNENIYLKDPGSSDLGRKIISESINMIDTVGFESFTFRKLGQAINSTEASVYRYFVSKHKLLLFLTSWYWGWMEYKMVFGLANIDSPEERLTRALKLITEQVNDDITVHYVNVDKLNRIVISESSKSYLTKEVDQENGEGFFTGYKQLVERISDIIHEINPEYKYPHMLISTVMEGSHHEHFFARHLPRLTDIIEGEDSITEFYKQLVFSAIR
jgi:AcrR family transcriptional regulator